MKINLKYYSSFLIFFLFTVNSFSSDTIKGRIIDSSYSDDAMYKKLSAATKWFGGSSAEKPELWNEASAHTFWLIDPWFKPTANYTLQFLIKQLKK